MARAGDVEWLNGGGRTAGLKGGGRRWWVGAEHNGHSQLIINTLNEQQPRSRGPLWPERRGHFPGDPKLTLVDGRERTGILLGEWSR